MKNLLVFLAIIMIAPAFGQTEFSLYRLNGNLPQANQINPAFYPNSKVVIGLPVISSIYASADNDGLSFSGLFNISENDSLALDTTALFNSIKPSQRIQFNEALQLFYFGLRGKHSYFSLGIHQVSETRFNYPGDLLGWAIRGPGDPHYAGKPLDFSNFYGSSVVYNKVSVNYARDITSRLRIGARFNYLLGVAAGETTTINGSLTMSTDSVNLRTGNILVQTGGVDFFDQDDLSAGDYVDYFIKGKNKGMAWDFGAVYDITDNLSISAAVHDLGYITWKEHTRAYNVEPVDYTFKGFDLVGYLNQNSGQQSIDAEVDSLENLFTSTETTGNQFKTSLAGKFYAGINFKVLRVNNFSALFYADYFEKKINPAVSLGYNLQLGRLLNATVGLTYQNGKINNVGAGLALKLACFQLYASSDRAGTFVYPSRASRADAHLGLNLVFGKMKKKGADADKKEEEEEQETEEPVEEDSVQADSVVEEVTPFEAAVVQAEAPSIDTTAQEVQQPEAIIENEPEPPVVDEEIVPEPVVTKPAYEVVKRGSRPDELPASNYVIVGTFHSAENAQRYSRMLQDSGYRNDAGFVTAKDVYYVYVYSSPSLEETRRIRDEFRKKEDFQFSESWVLTVEE